MFSRKLIAENSTIRSLSQPRGHVRTHESLKEISRHMLEANFQVMRIVLNLRKGQERLKKIDLHPKSNKARRTIYDHA